MPRSAEHAVVIGASMAGLLAARALADAHERVTIVERDALPEIGVGRKAVPQDRHAHVLLASGRQALEELLPGIADELLADGAVSCKALREVSLVIGGHELTREADGSDVLLASRPLIEGHVRRRVLALGNVGVRERCEALDLLASPDAARVTGVRVRARGAGSGAGEPRAADLVVAAGGRAGKLPAWLESLGYERPEEERLQIDLMYVSRPLRLRPGALAERLILIGARPGLPRGLALIEQERGRWICTASGYGGGHRPPTDEAGYLDFLATVAPPEVVAAVRDAEPLGEFVSHGFPASQRRRYERLERFPNGLLAIGDAVSSFNPLYGQGMSVAALQALELRRCVHDGAERLAPRFFHAAGKVVDQAWELAVGGDLALPEVAGERPLALRLTNAYVERLLRVAERDPVVAEVFNDVCDLLAPSQQVMHPRILWRVARGGGPRPVAAALARRRIARLSAERSGR